jgi:hypothetical protein
MAESSLSVTRDDLRQEAGHSLGYARSGWDTEQTADIDAMVKTALRWFYYPPPLPGMKPHQWRFLRPTSTISVFGNTAGTVSGTPSYSNPSSTINTTAGIFVSTMLGKSLRFATSGNSYPIATVAASNQVTVTGDASGEGADQSITVLTDGIFALPDDFGAMEGPLTIESSSDRYDATRLTNEAHIRRLWLDATTEQIGKPAWAAVRPIAGTSATEGQRFELMIAPYLDATYTLEYTYMVLPDALTEGLPYHLGGAVHGETLLQAVRAACELKLDDERGVEWAQFMDRLAQSIQHDKTQLRARTGQYNGDRSDAPLELPRRRTSVTYGGTIL